MGSESSIFITRAVIFSLLFHAFVFIVMSFFLTRIPQLEVFSPIKVYFSASSPESASSESSSLESTAQQTMKMADEKLTAVQNTAPETEKFFVDEPALTDVSSSHEQNHDQNHVQEYDQDQNQEQILPDDNGVNAIVSDQNEQTEDNGQNEPVSETEAPESNAHASGKGADEEASDVPAHAVINSGKEPGVSEEADLQWDGGAAFLQFVPEPDFTLPFNAILPDTIMISFSVQSDGTVKSIRILPPGSGHISVDQQIRSYVNSFIFEPFNPDEEDKSGMLRLSLRKRGADGT